MLRDIDRRLEDLAGRAMTLALNGEAGRPPRDGEVECLLRDYGLLLDDARQALDKAKDDMRSWALQDERALDGGGDDDVFNMQTSYIDSIHERLHMGCGRAMAPWLERLALSLWLERNRGQALPLMEAVLACDPGNASIMDALRQCPPTADGR